jgi:hypothetical protein
MSKFVKGEKENLKKEMNKNIPKHYFYGFVSFRKKK